MMTDGGWWLSGGNQEGGGVDRKNPLHRSVLHNTWYQPDAAPCELVSSAGTTLCACVVTRMLTNPFLDMFSVYIYIIQMCTAYSFLPGNCMMCTSERIYRIFRIVHLEGVILMPEWWMRLSLPHMSEDGMLYFHWRIILDDSDTQRS